MILRASLLFSAAITLLACSGGPRTQAPEGVHSKLQNDGEQAPSLQGGEFLAAAEPGKKLDPNECNAAVDVSIAGGQVELVDVLVTKTDYLVDPHADTCLGRPRHGELTRYDDMSFSGKSDCGALVFVGTTDVFEKTSGKSRKTTRTLTLTDFRSTACERKADVVLSISSSAGGAPRVLYSVDTAF